MRLSVVPLVALAALLAGCAGGVPVTNHPKNAAGDNGPVHAVAVDERSFGDATYKLLLSGDNAATTGESKASSRAGLLIGVTRHQLVRAEQRFASGKPAAGLVAVGGAFLLGR